MSAPFGYWTSHLLYRAGALIAGHLGRETARRTAAVVGAYFRLAHPGVAATVRRQLAMIDAYAGLDRPTSATAPFGHFSRTVAEFLQIAAGRGAYLLESVDAPREDRLRDCAASGHGVIFLSAHIGNWELAGLWAASRGYDLMLAVRPHPNPATDRFFDAVRRRGGLKIFALGDDQQRLVSHLRNGGVLAILGDRNFTRGGRETAFLGGTTILPTGYLRLAQSTGAWILPGVHRRPADAGPGGRVDFQDPWRVDAGEDGLDAAFDRARDHLQAIISAAPAQWTVFDPVLETR